MRSLAAVAVLWGCTPLAGRDYQGTALLTVQGTVAGTLEPLPPLRVGLLWLPLGASPQVVVGEARPSLDAGALPAVFTYDVFGPPPGAAIERDDTGALAVAMMVAFEDGDGDGTFVPRRSSSTVSATAPDRLWAVAFDVVVVYVERVPKEGQLLSNPSAALSGYQLAVPACRPATSTDQLEVVGPRDVVIRVQSSASIKDSEAISHCLRLGPAFP